MPLLKFDILDGWTDDEVAKMLDAAHRAVLSAFNVPERDRYQVVNMHSPSRLIIQDTGLGIQRTERVILLSIVSRPRSEQSKQLFYVRLCDELKAAMGIAPSDVIVSFIINSDADWSFGNGEAQFITGKL
jgi:hypothetical protein